MLIDPRNELRRPPGEGWQGIIDELVLQLDVLDFDVIVLQCKEKFGSLRFYVNIESGGDWEVVNSLINAAEAKSTETCIDCGGPGVYGNQPGAWILTMCDECRDRLSEKRDN